VRRILSTSFVLFIFLLLISCGTPLDKYQPKNETEKELKEALLRHAKAREEGDVDKILSGLHKDCKVSLWPNVELSKQQLASVNADDWVYDGKVNFADPKFDISGDKAVVSLNLNLGVAGKRLNQFTLVNENNNWLISRITFDSK
jgi:hypothetical protein